MTNDSELPMEFLCNVGFLLQVCAPDPDADAIETDAAATVADRIAAWLRQLAPSGLLPCDHDGCTLPATDWIATQRHCPYHNA